MLRQLAIGDQFDIFRLDQLAGPGRSEYLQLNFARLAQPGPHTLQIVISGMTHKLPGAFGKRLNDPFEMNFGQRPRSHDPDRTVCGQHSSAFDRFQKIAAKAAQQTHLSEPFPEMDAAAIALQSGRKEWITDSLYAAGLAGSDQRP